MAALRSGTALWPIKTNSGRRLLVALLAKLLAGAGIGAGFASREAKAGSVRACARRVEARHDAQTLVYEPEHSVWLLIRSGSISIKFDV